MNKNTIEFLKTLVLYLILIVGFYMLNNPFDESNDTLESNVEFVYQEF